MSDLGFGFLLMGIGMVTVFAILLIVIFGCKLLIRVLNKVVPAGEAAPPGAAPPAAVDPGVRAVLEAAVAQISGGTGHIVNITKIG